MGRRRRLLRCGAALACIALCGTSAAYDPPLHQQFTFVAAKHLNRCLDGTPIPRLTPLQVRYAAKADVAQAQGSWFPLRWGYYDRAAQAPRKLLWVFDTRLHDHFAQLQGQLLESPGNERYSNLGYVVNYLQNMTSPAHVVPVYFSRWWRLNVSDRFDGYPIDDEALERAVAALDCAALRDAPDAGVDELLRETASATLLAVQRRIDSLPATWQAFWKLADDPEQFGEYGRAGNNFGRRVEFGCGDGKCTLLDDDPLYEAFALERHIEAVKATMRAMLWLQRRSAGDEAAR